MRLYLDANAIIYRIESTGPQNVAIMTWMDQAEASGDVVTSDLSRMECRVLPLRQGNTALLQTYDTFFKRPLLLIAEVIPAIVDRATNLRVRYNLKTPDAIHVATAIECRADRFLTGDKGLARVREIPVTIV